MKATHFGSLEATGWNFHVEARKVVVQTLPNGAR
jgi:hypothetical protein